MADETNNKNAVFKFYLNRQGVKGNKGEKGEQGFSPVIEVSENTANSYKLQITTETDQFETPNLRGDEIDTSQGGTYVRYNEETQQMYVGAADRASTTQAGIIKIASDEDIANLSENAALTPDGLVNNASSILQSSDSSISIAQDPDTLKIDLKANVAGDISRLEARVAANELLLGSHQISINNLDRDKVDKVAGKGLSTNDFTDSYEDKVDSALQPTSVDGTTITYDSTTGKISSNIDASNFVSLNTNQSITGNKLFTANTLNVTNGSTYGAVAAFDSNPYEMANDSSTSRQAGVLLGGNDTGHNTTLRAGTGMFVGVQTGESGGIPIFTTKIADIYNTYNLTGGTNVSIIKNPSTGLYEIVAHDTIYSQGNGINIDNANQISVKVDGTTIQFNASGELETQTYTLPTASTTRLGGVKVDGTTITIDNNGVISSSGGSTPTNMVTTDTSQTITADKSFSGDISKDFSGDVLRLGTSSSGASGIICESNNGAKNWSIYNTGYTSSTFEIANFDNVTIQGGNLSSDSKLVIGHDSLIFYKSDDTVVDLLALEARISALEALINGGNA